jgi:hypothetical protein
MGESLNLDDVVGPRGCTLSTVQWSLISYLVTFHPRRVNSFRTRRSADTARDGMPQRR